VASVVLAAEWRWRWCSQVLHLRHTLSSNSVGVQALLKQHFLFVYTIVTTPSDGKKAQTPNWR